MRPDDLIAELEKLAMRTTQGSFVRIDDVRRLIAEQNAPEVEPDEPPPKNILEAHGQAKRYLERENGPRLPDLGRAIPATEPQPASRP